jgi:hypothetical protein
MNLYYTIQTTPIGGSNRTPILIDNTQSTFDYGLDMLEIYYNLFVAEKNTAHFRLIETNLFNTSVLTDFKEGDIITIIEHSETAVITLFVGFINGITCGFQQGQNAIDIICSSILSQWELQTVVQTSQSQDFFSTQGLAVNKRKLGDILDLFYSESLLSKVYNGQKINITTPTGNLKNNIIDSSSQVWSFVSPSMNRLQAINSILYPYQRLIYQQSNGQVTITHLSAKSTKLSTAYAIDVQNQNDNPYMMLGLRRNAGMCANKVITLFSGLNFILSTSEASAVEGIAEPSGIFKRPLELLNSGVFTNQIVDSQSIQQKMLYDSTFLTYMTDNKNYTFESTGIPADVGTNQQTTSIVNLYSLRLLATQLAAETTVTCTSPRVSTAGNDFPLGKMINIQAPNYIDVSSMLCIGGKIQYFTQQTICTLEIVKPYTLIPYWDY